MTPTRWVVALSAGLVVCGLVVVGLMSSAFATSSTDSGAELLDRARDAATRFDFTGEVVVSWRADGRVRQVQVPVREADGVLRVGKTRKVVGAGANRLMGTDGDWKRIWGETGGAGSGVPIVEPDRKYTLVVQAGPRIAGRATTIVEARRGGRVSEWFAVDDGTGLLLRREQLGDHGRVERSVSFTELTDPVATKPAPKAKTPRAGGTSPRQIATSPQGSDALRRHGDGFVLTGRYRGADDSVQRFYSDGIYAASVFEAPGQLDRRDLPDDATSVDVGGRRVKQYATSSGTVAVWEGDDHVYTLVSDAPKRDLDAIIDDLPRESRDDGAEEVTQFVLAPFRW